MKETGTFKSFDGVKIAYYVIGNKKGIPVVLSNGLGGNIAAWMPLIKALKDEYLFITWDYRGLYKSDVPDDLHTLAVSYQIMDLKILLQKLHIKKAVFTGWSMGVQINFEFYKKHPEMFYGITVLSGSSGYPFDESKGINGDTLKILVLLIKHLGALDSFIVKKVTALPFFFNLMKLIGLVSKSCSEKIFMDILKDFRNLDFSVYFSALFKLSEHSAEDVLPKIACPTLIVVGKKDLFTPLHVAQRMHKKIKHSELLVLPEATHYAMAEYPDRIIKSFTEFMNKNKIKKQNGNKIALVESKTEAMLSGRAPL